jgi:Cytochrome P450
VGQHTTSVALSRILHVLSLYPERQQRLRIELMDARVERRDISYDDLMALPYLDAVCKETLRLCVIYIRLTLVLPTLTVMWSRYAPATQLHLV